MSMRIDGNSANRIPSSRNAEAAGSINGGRPAAEAASAKPAGQAGQPEASSFASAGAAPERFSGQPSAPRPSRNRGSSLSRPERSGSVASAKGGGEGGGPIGRSAPPSTTNQVAGRGPIGEASPNRVATGQQDVQIAGRGPIGNTEPPAQPAGVQIAGRGPIGDASDVIRQQNPNGPPPPQTAYA